MGALTSFAMTATIASSRQAVPRGDLGLRDERLPATEPAEGDHDRGRRTARRSRRRARTMCRPLGRRPGRRAPAPRPPAGAPGPRSRAGRPPAASAPARASRRNRPCRPAAGGCSRARTRIGPRGRDRRRPRHLSCARIQASSLGSSLPVRYPATARRSRSSIAREPGSTLLRPVNASRHSRRSKHSRARVSVSSTRPSGSEEPIEASLRPDLRDGFPRTNRPSSHPRSAHEASGAPDRRGA